MLTGRGRRDCILERGHVEIDTVNIIDKYLLKWQPQHYIGP